MVGNAKMALKLCLQNKYQLVDVCISRINCFADCIGNSQFSGNKSGHSKSREEFEDGIKNHDFLDLRIERD